MIFKSKKIEKGVAFPTCVSVNEQLCHYSPLSSESKCLKLGDWIKIDVGCHIDGYIAVTATTMVVSKSEGAEDDAETKQEYSSEEENLMIAAQHAVDICARMIKPGNTNVDVTKALEDMSTAYGVAPIHGTIMHQMKRFVIDGNKMIAQKLDPENRTEKITFEENEVYGIDVCFTTGMEKSVESEERTTVFKRAVDKNYRLKMKASKFVVNEVNKKCTTLPFSIRSLSDERMARMGVVECVKHGLLQAYPVLQVRPEDKVVHLKATLLLLPAGNSIITDNKFQVDGLKSDNTLPEELQTLVNTPMRAAPKKKKKSKKKPKKTATASN